MKKVLALAGILIAVHALAREVDPAADAVTKGQAAVEAWLTLTDAGKYGESWEAGAAVFKAAVTKAAWEKAMTDSRKPLGAVKSRKLKSATFSTSLPQAPPGEYVIVQYDTIFDG
jgi:predicted transcriptional regulator